MIEEKLRELIIERFKSVKAFAMFIEVPYTTLDSILKRGIDKANVLNIIKICNALDIDIDALANGRIQSKIKLVKTPLTAYEQAHIQKYRKLDASGRDMVDTVLGKEVERLEARAHKKGGEEYITLPIAARGPMSDDAVLTAEEKAAADAKHPELTPKNKKSDY